MERPCPMRDFQDDDRRYGSRDAEEIDRRESSREGQPFDDGDLIQQGWRRTIFNFDLPDYTPVNQQCRYDIQDRPGVEHRRKKFYPRRLSDTNLAPDVLRFKRDRGHNVDFIFGPGKRRVIYNWPAIVRVGPPGPVFVTEGERNAQDLIDRGLLATTVINKTWTAECVGALSGFELFIMEDNDESGRRYAAYTQGLLSRVAESTRVVTMAHLWRHLPRGNPDAV